MSRRKTVSLAAIALTSLLALFCFWWVNQATATKHAALQSALGQQSNREALVEGFKSGAKVQLNTIVSASWTAPLSGLLNLKHPKAASLKDHEVAIEVYIYHLKHPVFGDFLIDTGVAQQFFDAPQAHGMPRWLANQFGLDKMSVLTSTEELLAGLEQPLKGVFLSHLHLDHISGLPAIDRHIPLYVGEGESQERFYLFAATGGVVDTLLEGRPALQEWSSAYVDVFGDGSVFAIHSPGHTAGSTAYLVNTDNGPVLLTGDVSHSAWGWQNQVEPGSFSVQQKRSRESLRNLQELVQTHPEITVKLGHQPLSLGGI